MQVQCSRFDGFEVVVFQKCGKGKHGGRCECVNTARADASG